MVAITTLFLIITLAAALLLFLKILYRDIVILTHLKKLPGPPASGLGNISELFDTPENIFKVVRKWGLQYYPIYENHAGHLSAVQIVNPYDLELILSGMKHSTKSFSYKTVSNWLGTGLLTSSGKKWQTRRKILTPSFHFNILQEFITVFNEETNKLVKILKSESHKPFINITPLISECTLKAIGETAMGVNFEFGSTRVETYKKGIQEMGYITLHRILRPWLMNDFFYFFSPSYWREKKVLKTLHEFTRSVIKKREESFKPILLPDDENYCYSKKKRLAMLDLLLQAKKVDHLIDDDGIREEVDTFMFEGHDTTAVALNYIIMLIAQHRQVQDMIIKEMIDVLGALKTPPTYADLQDMKYLERCIKEALRLYPSVPFIGRVLTEDLVTHDGYFLKSGTMMHLHIYDVHHNPLIYPDPEKFDPDRFLPQNVQNRHPFAYVPFSAGPRNCIGQRFAMLELKAVVCGILAEFVLEAVDTQETLVLVTTLVLRSKNGIKVKFVEREKN